MRIVTKINLALAAVVAVSGLLNFAALKATVTPRFSQIEDETALRNQDRVLEAIQLQQDQVAASARDYAFWDDSFAYMHGQSETYEAKNVQAESLKALNVNFYLAIEPDGRVKIDKGFIYSSDDPKPIRLLSEAALPEDHPLRMAFPEPGSRAGLVNTSDGVVAVGYAPILDSERNGPAAGTLLFGKFLDLDLLRATTKVDFQLRPSGETFLSNAMTHGDSAIEVATTLKDIEGRPIAELVSRTDRSVSAAGEQAIWAALALLALGGVALILTLAFILRRIALKRIERMQGHLVRIKSTGVLEPLPSDRRQDELSQMVLAFNEMTVQLEQLREQLRRQDYQHGAADQAADILHNVRNAISPIGAIISDIESDEGTNWKGNLEKALAELKEGGLPIERQGKLTQFVSLSAGRLLEEERRRRTDIKTLQGLVRHIEGVLREEETTSKGARVVEAVDLRRQVESVARVATRPFGIAVEVDIPSGMCAWGHRMPLEQIWGNLLINAAEAITANGGGGGIRVRAAETDLDGTPAIDVQVIDDGDGIAADHIEKIFQKGFSTRRERSGGLGLHWCATAAGAMGGRLFAESAGPGQGATLHLVLPRAAADARSAA